MSFYPYKLGIGRKSKTEVDTIFNDFGIISRFNAPLATALDVDYFVVSTDMIVGAYTLAETEMPDGNAHNVTVTQTAVSTEDTNGTIVVVGTDLNGDAITETLTPNNGETVAGAKAFATITSMTGVGWVVADGADQVTLGYGDILGLPDLLPTNTVLLASLDSAIEATAPTVTTSASALESNTVDLNTALDGTDVDVYYIAF